MRDKRTPPENDRLQALKFIARDAASGLALWRSGDAAECKSVHAGSIPAGASRLVVHFFPMMIGRCQAR